MPLTQPSYGILGVWTECYERIESQIISQVEQRDIRKLRVSGEMKQEVQSGGNSTRAAVPSHGTKILLLERYI
jgi:hypothetical protein